METFSGPSGASPEAVAEAAARLAEAARTARPCPPVRDLIGREDVAAAYAVQQLGVADRTAAGARIVGRKIGLTSVAVQEQLGVDQPDFGFLFDDMAYASGDVVPARAVLQPKAEAEVAFVLAADLDADDLDLEKVRSAIAYTVAALEICGSRIAGWDISFGDTVADNASAGAYVLGSQRFTLEQVEPREVEMTLQVNGEVVSTGNGAACMGDPLEAVLWLARTSRDLGQPLKAGQIVLSGALGPMYAVHPGDVVRATIGALSTVEFTLEEQS